MMRRISIFRRLRHAQRAVAAVALCVYAALAIGVPLPATLGKTDRAGTSPCEGHRCGCSTASQCWRTCCCTTPRQRMAWASRHRVTPPQDLRTLAKAEPSRKTAGGCCERHDHDRRAPRTAEPVPQATATPWVSLIQAKRCQGETGTWLCVPGFVPPQPVLSQARYSPAPTAACELPCLGFVSAVILPPDPPPRAA